MLRLRIFYRGFGLAAKICPLPLSIPLPFKPPCFKTPLCSPSLLLLVLLVYSTAWAGERCSNQHSESFKLNVQECRYYVFDYLRL